MKQRRLKRGFTLIEILAVIVILVIILIIAVPQVLRIISNAKAGAAESSAKGIDDSAENFHINKLGADPDNQDEIIFECDGTSCATAAGDVLSIDGTIPTDGKIMIDNTGEVFYLENLVIDEQTCFKTAGGDFKCTEPDATNKYKAIYSIEDLVEFAIEVDNGNDYKDGVVNLVKNLDFNDNGSYIDPITTSFGDINKNGLVEGLKIELTTGQGFNPIGELITSERANVILAMDHSSLTALLPIINQTFDILDYYVGFSSLDEVSAYFSDPADLASEIIWMYINMGEFTEEEDYHYNVFTGIFDGNKYELSNIYINKPSLDYAGLFARIEYSTISDLGVNGNVFGKNYVGIIGGYIANSIINNIDISGVITASDMSGSIAGYSYSSTVTNCSSTITANGEDFVGGLFGYSNSNTITKSSSTVNLTGVDYIGGFAGGSYMTTIANSSSTPIIQGNNYVGGFEGASYFGTMSDSSATVMLRGKDYVAGLNGLTIESKITNSNTISTITSTGQYVGGLVGFNQDGIVTNCYSKGNVNAPGNVGGLVGMHVGRMSNSYSNVTVTSSGNHVGGLIGMIGCSNCNHSVIGIKDCYSTGNVTSVSETGGLVGQNAASSQNSLTKYILIKNSYSLGNVTATGGAIGGLVGSNIMSIENSFAKGNVKGTTIGNLLGNPENATYTMTNTYSISTQVLTGTATIRGLTVLPSLLNTTTWWQSTLNLGPSFKYEDGYYPLLYKLDSDGNVTNELIEGQTKIPTP